MSCYCHTCEREFQPLGIMSHRAMHRRRGEDCEITFTNGRRFLYTFSKEPPRRTDIPKGREDENGRPNDQDA